MEPVGSRSLLPKLLYGALFILILPVVLALWARTVAPSVPLPVPSLGAWSLIILAAGVVLMLAGMAALWFRGGGLPMNAFPPPRFVSSGIYALVPHPIYAGFVIACAGTSLLAGSASGFWLVTPLAAAGCAALVLGYELPDLQQRFGNAVVDAWLPADAERRALLVERLRVYLLLLLPWLVVYQSLGWLGPAPDAVAGYMAFESHIPVIQWTEIVYGSPYLVVVLAPLVIARAKDLRRFAVRGATAMAVVFPLYWLLPLYAPARPFVATNFWGRLLLFERSFSKGAAAFPSFHVVWAFLAAASLAGHSRMRQVLWYAWAVAVAVTCMTAGMHSLADVMAGFVAFLLILLLPRIWHALLAASERIVNSWREWRVGPVRIINHGAYAGAATFAGLCVMSALLGRKADALLLTVYVAGTAGAALWAQWVEGSPALLRPLGFYGALLGTIAGVVVMRPNGYSAWTALAALSVAAPFVQALGRLRCLVQGCCHGREAHTIRGLHYTHPRSRVTRLSKLGEAEVHATPLYSILWNGVVACLLLRLVSMQASATTVCAAYLIGSGMGRFVEEAYRGEPQTMVFDGLRLYQWAAIACVVAGALVMSVRGASALEGFRFHQVNWVLAAICGLAAWFVTGVDFPESNRRFARLT